MVDLKNISPNTLWYFVGYMATDGYLSKDGRHLNLTSKDTKHLKNIRDALGLKVKLGQKVGGYDKTKKYTQLQFGDVKLYHWLIKIGFEQQKTFNLGALDIPNKYFADFLRGVIDGDGSISTWVHSSNNRRQWSIRVFSASLEFSKWLLKKTQSIFHIRGRLHATKSSGQRVLYVIKFGKLPAKIILKRIYYPNALCLNRKLIIANKCLRDKSLMINYADIIRPSGEIGKLAALKML